MIVSVHCVIVTLVILIDETSHRDRFGAGRAEIGAVQLSSAAAVKVTDHQFIQL
jgi:hypothetical protein